MYNLPVQLDMNGFITEEEPSENHTLSSLASRQRVGIKISTKTVKILTQFESPC